MVFMYKVGQAVTFFVLSVSLVSLKPQEWIFACKSFTCGHKAWYIFFFFGKNEYLSFCIFTFFFN